MKVYLRGIPSLKNWVSRPSIFTILILSIFLSIEILGRRSPNDFNDVFFAFFFILTVFMINHHHRRSSLLWVERLGKWIRICISSLKRFRFDFGIDLRIQPNIPKRFPFQLDLLIVVLLVANLFILSTWYFSREGWRSLLMSLSYDLYLVVLLILWITICLSLFLGISLQIIIYKQVVLGNIQTSKEKNSIISLLPVFAYFVASAYLSSFLPRWAFPASCLAIVVLAYLGRRNASVTDIQIIWRPKKTHFIYAIPIRTISLYLGQIEAMILCMILLGACGGSILNYPEWELAMPITSTVGGLTECMMPGLVFALLLVYLYIRKHNPSRPSKPILHLAGFIPVQDRYKTVKALHQLNWKVVFDPMPPRAGNVKVHLVEPGLSEANEFMPKWPLRVTLDELVSGKIQDRLLRRDELIKRYRFFRRTRKLFRYACNKQYNSGIGFWFAPHLWFQPALCRDDDYDPQREGAIMLQLIGPPYRNLYDQPIRHYLHQVLRAVQVDLIFIEDGIRLRKIQMVLRKIFDIYDRFEGKKSIEEIHFQEIPGVRIMIHDLQIDFPFESNLYPEPRYENLGRARILHIFYDRGDQEELLESPGKFDWKPAPIRN